MYIGVAVEKVSFAENGQNLWDAKCLAVREDRS